MNVETSVRAPAAIIGVDAPVVSGAVMRIGATDGILSARVPPIIGFRHQ